MRLEAGVLTAGLVGKVSPAPDEPTLIYDGGCEFCRKWVARAHRWDRHGAVRTLPLQDEQAPVVSGRPVALLRRAVHFVRPDGVVFAGAAATVEFFRYLPGGWVVRAVGAIPGVMPVAERLYQWVARRWGPVSN